MHSKERQQLVEFYSRDARRSLAPPERGSNKPASLLTLMLKCAACVAVVTLLMVIGNGEYHAGIDAAGRSDPAHQATVNTSSRTAADRKEVFDVARGSRAMMRHLEGVLLRRVCRQIRPAPKAPAPPAQAASTAEWMPAAANATNRRRLHAKR